jgi:hypothetical protein
MNGNSDGSPTGRRPSRLLLVAILVSVAVVVAGGLTAVVLLARSGGAGTPAAAPTSAPAVSGPGTTLPTTAPGTTAPGPTTPGMTTPKPTPTIPAFAYQPLWPFASQAEAAAWQEGFRSGGHQPWHLDAGLTALAFTQGYLGYTNVDKAIKVVASGREDWVSVGFDNPNGQPVVSAVLHLVRFGADADAPWEVVGTQDTTLTLTTPAYGSTVRSPVTVGGLVSGVDENLRVQIRQLNRPAPLAAPSGVPAGGNRTPWSVQVPFPATAHGVLTIAVATGGHIAQVERFAITGVRS